MSTARSIAVAFAALGLAVYLPPPAAAQTSAESAAAASLRDAGSVERLGATRWPSNGSAETSAPGFVVDASWPKPLPNHWRIGQVGGIAVDSHDHIWVYHRPRTLDVSSAGALPRVATNEQGVPVSGLGHPRPYAEVSTGCCVPAPAVLKFDREGNLLDAWGGPSDPGFLDKHCREADGCFWPAREHGIYVDHNDFVYLAGNGQDNGSRQQQGTATYPWAPSFGDDSHILKFTADGTFVFQIGQAGMTGPNSEKIDGGPNGTPQPYLVADMNVDPATNRLYVADGYGNRRILIVDAATGGYIGHFGAYGQNPVVDDPSSGVADTEVGPWIADYQAGRFKPPFFRSPLHCATVSRDGRLYACDRGNNRIQVFDLNAPELGKPCANQAGEIGRCGFVREVLVAPQTASGTSGTATLSTDPGQTCLYVGDLANGTLYVLDRENLTELDRIGRAGRQAGEFHWLHALAVDSRGDIYTGEVDTGQRVQRFVRHGAPSCGGIGNTNVGAYDTNGDADMPPVNDPPNPYAAREVMPLPDGRSWGSTAGVDAAKGRNDFWAIDRCGSNTCVGSPSVDPLLHYDANGNLIGRMGAGLFAFPHGIHVDGEGNVWVTDPLPPDGRGAGGDVGQQVTKLSPSGEILLQLGTRMVAGDGPNQFSSPSDVVVGANGDIFVADGHGEGTNERIMKFDRNGNFIEAWGRPGNGPCGIGEFSSLHALAIDSQGRLFIGDRDNNRIQIYDQDGNYLDCWYQFGRPSGIYIDADDNLFVGDSESRDGVDSGMDLAHPGWQRGIRIGSARDGVVKYFIPDPAPQGGSSTAEGVAAIGGGAVVLGAEVGPRALVRYLRQ